MIHDFYIRESGELPVHLTVDLQREAVRVVVGAHMGISLTLGQTVGSLFNPIEVSISCDETEKLACKLFLLSVVNKVSRFYYLFIFVVVVVYQWNYCLVRLARSCQAKRRKVALLQHRLRRHRLALRKVMLTARCVCWQNVCVSCNVTQHALRCVEFLNEIKK